MPPRAEAVKADRHCAVAAHSSVSRPRLDSFEHGGRLDERGLQITSYINCRDWSPLVFPRVELMSLPDPPFSTRSSVAGRTMAFRVSTPLCPERTQPRSAQEESRGRRGPSQQGQRSAARCGESLLDRLRRPEFQLQHSTGMSRLWSTCDAG
jgi:hypothetical protein